MGPPTTIRCSRGGCFTILNKQQGRCLSAEQRRIAAEAFALHYPLWRLTVDAIVAHGLAEDVAEADELLAEL